MLVSGIQQSDSVIYVYTYSFSIIFPYRLLQNIEYSSLCYTVDPCWLSILYIVVCICKQQGPIVCSSGNCIQYLVIISNGKNIYIYIIKSESLCCIPETNTTL